MDDERRMGVGFGELLRRYRVGAGLSQEELAERAGLSADAVSLLERGERRQPRRDTVQRLVGALALPSDAQERLETAARRVIQPPADLLRGAADTPTRHMPTVMSAAPLTPVVGREHDEAAVVHLLIHDRGREAPVRLLTLTGPGGVGKTRLALRVVETVGETFAEGAVVVALAALRDATLVPAVIAGALGLAARAGQSMTECVTDYLRDRDMLLLLDNVEQVLDAAPVMVEIVSACPRLRLLVTSRAALRVRGEQEYAVRPLPLPDPAHVANLEALSQNAAVALFVARARAARSDMTLTSGNAAAVAAICRRLDGLPLALELAAAWSKTLAPAALLARLEWRLPLLVGGARDLPVRQRTMRDAIAWSYALLDADDQALFRRLSVCMGGCGMQAAEELADTVVVAGRPPTLTVLQGVASLADKSLLRVVGGDRTGEEGDDEPRVVMLETIREYGVEQLQATGEADSVRSRHLTLYLALAERAERALDGPERRAWLEQLEREHDNLRAALRWAQDSGQGVAALRLVGALWPFWSARGYLSEGRGWARVALDLPSAPGGNGDHSARAKALIGAAMLAIEHASYDEAEDFCERGLALVRAHGRQRDLVAVLNAQGLLARERGRYPHSMQWYDEALAVARAAGDQAGEAAALAGLGAVVLHSGDSMRAQALLEHSLSLYRSLGNTSGRAWVLSDLVLDAIGLGALDRAEVLGREALALFRALDETGAIAVQLFSLGHVARDQGHYDQAAAFYEESMTLYRQRGDDFGAARPRAALGQVALLRGDLPRARALLTDVLATERRHEYRWGQAITLTALGHVELAAGALDDARALLNESSSLVRAIGNPLFLSWCLEGLAGVAAAEGQFEQAALLCGARDAGHAARGSSLPPMNPAGYAHTLATTGAALGEEAFAQARARGAELSLAQLMDANSGAEADR